MIKKWSKYEEKNGENDEKTMRKRKNDQKTMKRRWEKRLEKMI